MMLPRLEETPTPRANTEPPSSSPPLHLISPHPELLHCILQPPDLPAFGGRDLLLPNAKSLWRFRFLPLPSEICRLSHSAAGSHPKPNNPLSQTLTTLVLTLLHAKHWFLRGPIIQQCTCCCRGSTISLPFPYVLPARSFPGICCPLINGTQVLRSSPHRPEAGGGHGFNVDLCGAIPAKSLTCMWLRWLVCPHSASRLNVPLLSLLSALTTCLELLNGLCLELKAPWRL